MTDERWRCFVAVRTPDAVRAPLAAAVARWRSRADLDGLRWVPDDRWHLTLAFLGAITPEAAARAASAIDDVARDMPLVRTEAGAIGGFPSSAAARVAWLGVGDPAGEIGRAASALAGVLGIEQAPLHPHLTLARARSRLIDLRPWIAEEADGLPRVPFVVDRVELIRSHLGAGSRYETLHTALLRAGAHA